MGSKQAISLVVGVVIIAAVAAGAMLLMKSDEASNSETNATATTNEQKKQRSDANQAVQTEDNAVIIQDFKYGPETITVKAGTTVTWTNQDTIRHNVVTDGEDGPNGPLLAQGESYSFTFDTPGTYEYYCQPHPYMKATVVVTE